MKSENKKNRLKIDDRKNVAFVVVFLIFALYAVSMLYSLGWLLNNSVKTIDEWDKDHFGFASELFKSGKFFTNYVAAWTELNYGGVGIPGMIINSIWYSFGGAFVSIWFSMLTAYIISKYRFIGRNWIYGIAIFQMLLPIVGNLPATYKMYNDLSLTDSPLILITSASGLGGNFLIMYASFQGVSNSYKEAAEIDGAGHYAVFFKVMLPQVVPPMFALIIMAFIGLWNDYMGPLLYLESFPTLSTGLMIFEKDMTYDVNMPVFFAGCVLLLLPALILFAVFSDTIMTNVSTGGIKG